MNQPWYLSLRVEYNKSMKKSEQFTSPASFLKKQSHIITNNGVNQEYFQMMPNNRYELDVKEMHRSHFHSEANSTKLIEDNYFDQHDILDMYSEGKEKPSDEDHPKNTKLLDAPRQPFESFYQSDEQSSEHENSQTKSHKKFGLTQYTMSEKIIKRVGSNKGDDKFLYINSKKQKYNNNYMFLSDSAALKEEIRKYEISVEKLKEENFRLRSEKVKLTSTNESMQLIELRLELEALKKKIKQLETQKEMHITINQKEEKGPLTFGSQIATTHTQHTHNYMATSCLETSNKTSQRDEISKRNIPTFRNNQQKNDCEVIDMNGSKILNSPRSGLGVVMEKHEGSNLAAPPSYRILQNMKSPYFLKKG